MNLGSLVVAAVLFRDLIMQGLPSKFTRPTVEQTGALSFDEFLATVCPACSHLDYEDWLKGL